MIRLAAMLVSLSVAGAQAQDLKKLEDECYERLKPLFSKKTKIEDVRTFAQGKSYNRSYLTLFTVTKGTLPKGFVHTETASCMFDAKTLKMVRDDYTEFQKRLGEESKKAAAQEQANQAGKAAAQRYNAQR